MDPPNPPGGDGSAAYRDERAAAAARVQALERELGDARLRLAAMRPPPAPGAAPALLRGLGLLLWAAAVSLGVSIVEIVGFRWVFSSLGHESFRYVFAAFNAGYIAAAVLALLGLTALVRPAAVFRAGGLATTSLVGHAAAVLLGLLGLVQTLGTPLSSSAAFATAQQVAWRVIILACNLPLLVIYQRLARHVAARGLGQLALAALITFCVQQALAITSTALRLAEGSRLGVLDDARWWLSLGAALLLTIVAVLAPRAARAAPLKSAAPTPGASDPAWRTALTGLRLHRAGVLLKVVTALAAVALLAAAAAVRSADAVKLTLVFTTVAGLFGGGLAFWGVVLFARAPDEAGGGGLALAAALLMGGGLLVDLAVLVTLGTVLSGAGEMSRLRDLQALEPVSLGLALAALLLLLSAFARVAQHLSADDPVRRARQLRILVAILLPAAVVLKIPDVARAFGPLILALALPLLGLAIYTLVRYLGLLGGLIRSLEHRTGGWA